MPRRTTRRPGRPTSLTEDVRRRLLDLIRTGVPVTHAARAAGVSPDAYFGWMRRGEEALAEADAGRPVPDAERWFAGFATDALRARSEAAVRGVALVQKAAAGGYVTRETTRTYRDESGRQVTENDKHIAPPEWRAAAFLMERAFREDFGKAPTAVEVSGPAGGPLQVAGQADVVALADRIRANLERIRPTELPAGAPVYDGEVVP